MRDNINIRIDTSEVVKNNDPLAHVYLALDSGVDNSFEQRMHTEFVTDIGERLKNQPFCSTYNFSFDGNEVVYDTGLSLIASLEKSYRASIEDVRVGEHVAYHANRQKAFLNQGRALAEWLRDSTSTSHVIFASLCPPDSELAAAEAVRQGFKPDRLMASIQIHHKSASGYTTTAFSLDKLTLNNYKELLQNLGIAMQGIDTTLALVERPIYVDSRLSSSDVASMVIAAHDNMLQKHSPGSNYTQGVENTNATVEANRFVEQHAEAYALYRRVVQDVAASLHQGAVNSSLEQTIQSELSHAYMGNALPKVLLVRQGLPFDATHAAQIIEYVRSRAVPEYLTNILQHRHHMEYGSADTFTIGFAGAAATNAGRIYEGACPGSALANINDSIAQSRYSLEQQMQLLRVVYETPKPLFSKNGYDVIPIGSCPVCGSECGVGIQNKKTKKWHCIQIGCAAYDKNIYNAVYKNESLVTQESDNLIIKKKSPNVKISVAERQRLVMTYKDLYWDRWLARYKQQHATITEEKLVYDKRCHEYDEQLIALAALINRA